MASKQIKPIETLLNILHYDSGKRLEVLREEITHLTASIGYRVGDVGDGNVKPKGPVKVAQLSSQAAFLARLRRSAEVLLAECEADLKESRGFRKSTGTEREVSDSRGSSSANGPGPVVRLKSGDIHKELAKQYKRELLWNAKIINKALVIAERLGDLHDRLELFLQRTNPDQPDPTLRRRSEQGLADKYLSEKARWVHKDLARLVMHLREGQYPFAEVPSTYQFWAYDHTSHHHSFTSLKAHNDWVDVSKQQAALERNKTLGGRLARLARLAQPKSDEDAPKADTSERFVCLSLSYWVPDRIALVPIIGHELAHEVLRSTYGRLLNVPRAEQDPTELGRVYRRLTRVTEAWLSNHPCPGGAAGRSTDALVHEILCDVLATIRFGHAYVYAWTLEMLADERLANLFHDEYGMLRRAEFDDATGKQPDLRQMDSMSKDAEAIREHLSWSPPLAVYRGHVLLNVLRGLELEKDPIAEQFLDAFEGLLGLMLDLYAGPDEARQYYELQVANELARAVCEETLFEDAGVGIGESQFLTKSRGFWKRGQGGLGKSTPILPTLEYQCLSEGFRRIVDEAMEPLATKTFGRQVDSFSLLNCPHVTGVAWRAEWLLDLALPHCAESAEEADAAPLPSKGVVRDIARRLNFLGMDDYLFQTLHPARLFAALGKDETHYQLNALLGDRTNLLKDSATRKSYDKEAIRILDKLKLSPPLPTVEATKIVVRDAPVLVATEALQWLGGPVLSGGIQLFVRRSMQDEAGNPCSRTYFLDLMKLRMNREHAGLDFHVEPRASDGERGKYVVECDGALLGRYDGYVLYWQQDSHGQLGWDFKTGAARGRQESESITCHYASRGRRMVQVYSSNPGDAVPSPFAVILVSLKWDASRLVVANWLASQATLDHLRHPPITIFLSDGWEDLVVFVGTDHSASSSDEIAAQFEHCRRTIEHLNTNPFVATTESLFSRDLLTAPPDSVRLRFACRVGDNGYAVARKQLGDVLANVGDESIEFRDVAGNKDFEISIERGRELTLANDLYQRLHRELGASCRIETRVAWSSRASS
ncbi:hypothetical protein [Roseateles sp.]|uniref:hypothetical protein n=1 Tax=Roseateles sp. TaxID=1971397 RepID=UPI003D0C32E3